MNVRQKLLAITTAVAAFALAPSANASVTLQCPDFAPPATCTFDEVGGTGLFGDSFQGNTAFTDVFKIVLSTAGKLSITMTKTAGAISFVSKDLVGVGAIVGLGVPNDFFVGPGTYDLKFVGNTTGTATYSGTIDFAAVPEPATWAMMIAGLGVVGMAMRRRTTRNAAVSFV